MTLLNIYFMYEVAHYRGPVYRLITILSIASIFLTISNGGELWDILISGVLGNYILDY